MRKDSVLIFGLSAVITVGIVAGAFYLYEVRPAQQTRAPAAEQPSPVNEGAVGATAATQSDGPAWTNTPIKCVDPEIGEFWTNARDCESADLKNRISIAQPTPRAQDSGTIAPLKTKARSAEARAAENNKPNIRQVARSVSDGLSISCKFAVGKALELERDLSAADDPAESIWRENYCRWVNEARNNACSVSGDFFYYGHLCGFGLRNAN